jgi:AraC-like DNA-binding protein
MPGSSALRLRGPLRVVFLGGREVSFEEQPPPPALAPWIGSVWRLKAHERFELRILPDACMDLIAGDVIGPFTTAKVVTLEPGAETIGIRFRPGGFPALYGVPAAELLDLRVPLADVTAPRALHDRAGEAPHPDPLAELAVRATDVAALASASGYSQRQLRRRVVAATGLGPKRVSRIGRMHALLVAGRGDGWARTAFDHGYYDEAHMANDIRDLAGKTPHALLASR